MLTRVLLLALLLLLPTQGWGAITISRISAHSAQANSVTITTPTAKDLILCFAHRDGSNTAPSTITGYTSVANSGANTNSARLMFKISDGTETSSGTSTNATSIACGIYRGHDPNVPVGAIAAGGAASSTLSYTGITLQSAATAESWVVGFGAHRTATDVNQAPSGMTVQSSATDIAISDTNGTTTTWTTQTDGVNASSGWRTYVVEIRAKHNTPPATDPLVQHVSSQSPGETANTFKLYFPNLTLANNLLVLCFTHTTGVSVTSVTDDKSNTWTAGPTAIAGNGNMDSRCYYVPGATAATSLITVVLSGTVTEFRYDLSEFYGPNTSSVIDGTSTSSNSAVSPFVQSGSITTTQAGDLIYQYTADVVTTAPPNNTLPEGIAADQNMVLLSAHRMMVHAAQYGIQSASGAINPGVAYLQTQNPDVFNSISMAFKMNGSGTAPSGMRIVHLQTEQGRDSTNFVHQFPANGNLLVAVTSNSTLQITWSNNTDTMGNTWTEVQLDDTTPQLWYASPATTSTDMSITETVGTQGLIIRWYDIAGAHATAAHDTDAWATGTQGAAGADVTNAPSITPSVANGLIITSIAFGTGPPTSVYGPTGAIFDNSPYTGESDGGILNWGDGWGHYFNPNTSATNWNWHTNTPVASGWIAQASSFKPAAAGGGSTPHSLTLMGVGN